MSSGFSLGSITDLPVTPDGGGYEPLELEERSVRTGLLADTEDATQLEVLQEAGRGCRIGSVGGRTRIPSILSTLQGYFEDRDVVTFTDCDGATYEVFILEYESRRGLTQDFFYKATLVEWEVVVP